MKFDPKAGSIIPLEEAAEMTKTYRENNPGDTLAHYFSSDIINELLRDSSVVGLRMYYGLDPNNEKSKELILVGVDANGDDVTRKVADRSARCPDTCSNANELNS